MTSLTALHASPLILDYLNNRYFTGFTLKPETERIVFTSEDGAILSILRRANFIKPEDDEAKLDVQTLIKKRSALKSAARDMRLHYDIETIDLLEALNTLHAFSDPSVKQRLTDGYAMYADMPVLFPRGTEVICTTESGDLGGVVETCTEVATMFGNYFNIALSVIMTTSKGCAVTKTHHRVFDFPLRVAIDELSIRPIQPAQKATLTARGQVFREFAQRPLPASYIGKITIPTWNRDSVLGANGRVMVDALNFAQIDADLYHDLMQGFEMDDRTIGTSIQDDDLWRCYNRVQGFSMRLKRWGWLDVDGLQPVKWRTDAFEQLVLAAEYKHILLSLVKHAGSSFTDFIDGKSGGLVFLLNGPTGVGKTLTAEAVAEMLQRPLYPISVGELGTEPEVLEEKLRNVLDLAYQWNAVLLLDEADIYMEARDTNNIERNALVSIFLRLLEYYSGVLFLTTNRVKTFDPAFFSRISLAITYPKLSLDNRQDVWRNVLTSAGIDLAGLDLYQLAVPEVNGRNIKTTARIAQTLATAEERAVAQIDLLVVLAMIEKFQTLDHRG